MVEKILSRSVRLMFASGVVMGMGAIAQPAFAQDAAPQRIEITGSSIKRVQVEGALPVQTLSKAQIEQSGATTAADLIATLPSMQGFVTSSTSINGGGGGTQTASIHGIGDNYTLVLLNGRRVAPFTTGSTVNLASIPLSAVERVEILTDGASALYGSDAIAGVVNFVLKKNQKDFNVEFTYSTPQESSKGKTTNFALSKGFGDLNSDGYNVLLAYSHDEQAELNASDREFAAKGGVTPFKEAGKNYTMYMLSSNSIPGNVNLTGGTVSNFNPYLAVNGNCPANNTFQVGRRCLFNYGATVQMLPELKRDSFLTNVNVNINDDTRFFAEGMFTKFTSTARFAPPAQPLGIDLNSALWKNTIAPAYAKLYGDPTKITRATMTLRLVDAGGRTDGWATESKHLATGFEGSMFGWDYNTSYIFSENKAIDNAVAGYTSGEKLDALIKSGAWNPFLPPTAATKAALAPAVLKQVLDTSTSQINVLNFRASKELFKMAGGSSSLGLGLDAMRQTYVDDPSPIAQGPNKQQPNWTDTNVGGGTGALPVDSSRKSWGAFGELYMPLAKNFETTFAARYDSYDAVKNAKNFDDQGNLLAPAVQGTKQSSATYKLSGAFRPTDSMLLRASYGTGFKAPSMGAITQPISNGGSSNFFPCPITSGPLLPLCNGTAEYNLLSGGNSSTGSTALKPEKSTQWTMGFRIEPVSNISVGFDFWNVQLKDQIKTLSQSEVFLNPVKYAALFSAYYDPIQKQDVLAATLTPFNLANAKFQGIDWDHSFRMDTSMGKVTLNWTGTYMLKADLDSGIKGDAVEKSVGKFNKYNDVTFKIISRLAAIWKASDRYTHTATLGYHHNYKDSVITADDGAVRAVNADGTPGDYVGVERTVKRYVTVDWQSKINFSKTLTLTAGIKNLFNQDPPFSQRIEGGGNQLGYDGRYTDPLGRQFYVVGNMKF
ncbi:TonB-dependent receptor [Undibacterium sp. LX40W]|uniref:TonB-dependent receptor n=1 Tax=Undibacterium nitidum TaxID=2762298 RepID=A0A923HTN2_9BURK|nr:MULTISPECIES: TonB-dependent receptor [Undibacterium]MBC3880989.1 TonB-dependent receptor [Undibacterium nitidum]MBC3890278.1 TonB-dependent receptor [Undibacterium sp. LX40W]